MIPGVARQHSPTSLDLKRSYVVAVVHSLESLKLATDLGPMDVDAIEIRLDTLHAASDEIEHALPALPQPLILTARHPQEGGQPGLSPGERRDLLERFLPFASAIDVELRSIEPMAQLMQSARDRKVIIVVSHHNFHLTPSAIRLHELARRSSISGGDIFKLATRADNPKDLSTLLAFYAKERRLPLSVMAMGALGRISRLLFGQMNSVLNYGYLDHAAVPGQWPAVLLKKRLHELREK